MPKPRSSLAAWNNSGPNTIFCASRRASSSDIESIGLPSNDKDRDGGLSMLTIALISASARTLETGFRRQPRRRRLRIDAVATRGLDCEQAAVERHQRAQDLQPQEIGA